jgi:pimeloyl-ACP methyl ester carboxylesterase
MLDTRFHQGDSDRPLVIFIHGMGMDARLWAEPSQARVLAGRYPLSALLREELRGLRSSFHDLRQRQYPVLAWSQKRPVGPVMTAAEELVDLVEAHRHFSTRGVVLICHSRGGLVARKFLEHASLPLRGVVTLATPHHGTTMAKWGTYLAPYASFMDRMLSGYKKKEVLPGFRRILRFLGSAGLMELLPGSPFLASMKDTRWEGCRCLSFGGTDPNLIRIGGISLPELADRLFPGRLVPDEIRKGYGDGMVSAASARAPHVEAHHDVPVNHAEIVFDPDVRRCITDFVESL